MGNKDKDKEHSDAGAMGDGADSAQDAHQANRDLILERQATLDKMVVDAVARETGQITATFMAILKEQAIVSMPTNLKITSGAAWIKAMSPFDWTRDIAIYQRWQQWSEKARHALDVMEENSEKAKISYFHHWIDTEGMANIESWKNNRTLLKQEDFDKLGEDQKEGKYSLGKIVSYFTLFELFLSPKSNPLLAVEELCFGKQGSMNSGEFHSHITKIIK